MVPASIDSIGKPGTAGMTSGVVTLDVSEGVTVTVLTAEDVELDVLASLVVMLLDVSDVDVLA